MTLAQGAGELELPPGLKENPAVVEAWNSGIYQDDAQARADAAHVVLTALAALPGEEQAPFLLLAAGAQTLPIDLVPTFLKLQSAWPEFETYLVERLNATAGEKLIAVRGALFGAGALEIANLQVVEGIAGRLNALHTRDAARKALLRITQKEFSNWEAFGVWWETAREKSREDWLREAAEEHRLQVIALWRQRLSHQPQDALVAIQEPMADVRRLGYETMRVLDPSPPVEGLVAEVEALRTAFQTENSAALRRLLVSLVPRFLQGEDAMALLEQALESVLPEERLEAAQVLQLIRPADSAVRGLLRHLGRAYLQENSQTVLTGEFRLALWMGLIGVARETPGIRAQLVDTMVNTILLNALEFETFPSARERVYEAAGVLGGTDFHAVLLPHAMDDERPLADRRFALDALTAIALVGDTQQSFVENLNTLLSHPESELRYRAVLGLRKLEDAKGLEYLVARLGQEQEEFLILEILKSLSAAPAAGALDSLLLYRPAESTKAAYTAALKRQIGDNVAAFLKTLQAFENRQDWGLALALLNGFPADTISDTQQKSVTKIHAKVLSSWILTQTGLVSADARVLDALGRLEEMVVAYPDESEWPILLEKIRAIPAES